MSSAKRDRIILLFWVFTLLGLFFSATLSSHFYGLRTGTSAFKSYCNFSEKLNCDAVAASPYAELGFGFPLSSFGAGWYLTLFLMSFFAKSNDAKVRNEGRRFLWWGSIAGLAVSLYYLFVMALVLKTFCLFCLFLDAIALFTFLAAIFLRPEKSATKPDFKAWKPFLWIAGISMFATVVSLKGLDNSTLPKSEIALQVESILSQKQETVKVDPSFPVLGTPGAPITIVEFSDFQCPFCKIGALSLNATLQRFPGKIQVLYRNWPLDSACNRKVEQAMHPQACEAARVGLCAHAQGKFEATYEGLFGNQEKMGATKPIQMAADFGLDKAKLDACLSDATTLGKLTTDIEDGILMNVGSTPTFFVNGLKVEGALPPPVWIALIERLLKK